MVDSKSNYRLPASLEIFQKTSNYVLKSRKFYLCSLLNEKGTGDMHVLFFHCMLPRISICIPCSFLFYTPLFVLCVLIRISSLLVSKPRVALQTFKFLSSSVISGNHFVSPLTEFFTAAMHVPTLLYRAINYYCVTSCKLLSEIKHIRMFVIVL